jgi:cbb3-type cytochrome oxidase maturation protein
VESALGYPSPVTPRKDSPAAAASQPVDRPRALAALVCVAQALGLWGLCVFYLWEVATGQSDDVTRAVMSAILIAVFGALLLLLARAWWRGAGWPNTPTVVWNLLLLPVAWGLKQGGFGWAAVALAVVAVVGIVSALGAGDGSHDPPKSD